MTLIKPHGADALNPRIASGQRLADLREEADGLVSITV